jgi:hypothetical protein
MSGRLPKPLFEYTQDGKFVKEHVSSASFARENNHATNIASHKRKDYFILPNNNVVVKEKIGRTGITKLIRIIKSPFVRINKPKVEEFTIECYNLKDELIATFRSEYHLRALLNWTGELPYKQHGANGLLFKKA